MTNKQVCALYLWGLTSTPGQLVVNKGGLLKTDAGDVENRGTITVYGKMELGSAGNAPKLAGVGAGNDSGAGHLIVDGKDGEGILTVNHNRINFGGGNNWQPWEDAAEGCTVTIQNGGVISTEAVYFRNGVNNTLTLNNGTLEFISSGDYNYSWEMAGENQRYFDNKGVINASNDSVIDMTGRNFSNAGTITVADSTFTAGTVDNTDGTFTIAGASTVNASVTGDVLISEAGAVLSDDSCITVDGNITAAGDFSFSWNDVTADSISVKGMLSIDNVDLSRGIVYAGTITYGSLVINGSNVVENTIVVDGRMYDVTVNENGISVSLNKETPEVEMLSYVITGVEQTSGAYTFAIRGKVENAVGDLEYHVTISTHNVDGTEEVREIKDFAVDENGVITFTLAEHTIDLFKAVITVTDAYGSSTSVETDAFFNVRDYDKPVITVDKYTTDMTNENIVVKASVTDNFGDGKVTFEYRIGTGEWVKYDAEKGVVMENNGLITFKAVDGDGNMTLEEVKIENIDKVKPAVEVLGNSEVWTKENITLEVKALEGTSDIKSIEYQVDGGEWLTAAEGKIELESNGTVTIKVTDVAGNVTELEPVIVDKIDKDAPVVEVTGNASAWTNQNVILNVAAGADASGIAGIEYQLDGGEWITVAEGKIELESNGSVIVKVTDAAGNVTTLDPIVVDKIDKDAPVVEVTGNASDWTDQNVILNVVPGSDASGIASVMYQLDGGEWTAVADGKIELENNGTVTVKVTDVAGNETLQEIVVDKIDKEAPVVAVTGLDKEWTNAVTINVSDASGIKSFEYQIDGGDWLFAEGDKLVIDEYCTVNVKVTDIFGRVTEETVVVNNIDKELPGLEVSGNASDWTSGNVVLDVTATDSPSGIASVMYQVDGGEWTAVADGKIELDRNGTVIVKVTDVAGNEVTEEIIVDKIDKDAPVVTGVSGNVSEWTNQDVILDVAVEETISGIKSIEYQINGGEWIVAADGKVIVSENGTVNIKVTDNAGNVTDLEPVIVDKIDKDAPAAPVVSADVTEFTNGSVTLSAAFAEDSVANQFSYNGFDWFDYTGALVITENKNVYFSSVDIAGNVTETVYEVTNINPVADAADTVYVFVKSSYTAKNTSGKEQDGIALEYGVNAFSSMEAAQAAHDGEANVKYVVLDSKSEITADTELDHVDEVSNAVVQPVINEKAGTNSTTISSKGTLVVSGKEAGDTKFHNFSTVTVNQGSVVDVVDGGKSSVKETDKGISGSFAESHSGSGKATVSNASVTDVIGYSTVTAELGTVLGRAANVVTNVSNSYKNDYEGKVTRNVTMSQTTGGAGTVTVRDMAHVEKVEGFATVNVTDATTGDMICDSFGTVKETLKVTTGKDGKVTGTFEESVSGKRGGKVTVTGKSVGTVVGNVSGYNTVTLTNASAGDLANDTLVKKTAKYTQEWSNAEAYGKPEGDYDFAFDTEAAVLLSSLEQYAASGSATLKNGSVAGNITGYSKVTAEKSTVGSIAAAKVEDGVIVRGSFKNQQTFDSKKNTLTETETVAPAASVTLKESQSGDITGYKAVTLKGSSVGNVDFTEAYTTKNVYNVNADGEKELKSSTTTYTNNGSVTATDSTVGDISGYATVKLTGSVAGEIIGSTLVKVVDGVETVKLSGSVTLTGSEASLVENYKSLTMSGSTVEGISNVAKVTVSKGDNVVIKSYTGTEGDETLVVSKGAVLHLGASDFGGGKDTVNVAGTLVLDGEISGVENFTGKGEIAASDAVWQTLEHQDKVLNLSVSSANYRGKAFESADNTEKKAVKWDGSAFGGWLSGNSDVLDTVDYIKHTALEHETLEITGDFADGEVTLYDEVTLNGEVLIFENGVARYELTAGESYLLKLERKDGDSISYSIALA